MRIEEFLIVTRKFPAAEVKRTPTSTGEPTNFALILAQTMAATLQTQSRQQRNK